MTDAADPVRLLQDLIRCPSVTPDDAGVLGVLEKVLGAAGFACHRIVSKVEGHPDVENLFARIGTGHPHFCFGGHSDVVPPGEDRLWEHPPFAAEIADGVIYGRGACDMKGAVAAFACAAMDYAGERGDAFTGSISLIVVGDEEGPFPGGTPGVLAWLKARDELPDHAIVGEPTCPQKLGDSVKIGRRGSIHFRITADGVQGHSAYPHQADNPIPKLARLIDRVASEPLDAGNAHFDPSTLAVTGFDVGNPANNVIPARAVARFNIRYNNEHSPESLRAWVEAHCEAVKAELGGQFTIETIEGADCFLTEPSPLVEVVCAAIAAETGVQPRLNTSGGTSDARFIKEFCPVVEFGPVNRTIHQADESIAVADLVALTRVYGAVLKRYFAAIGP